MSTISTLRNRYGDVYVTIINDDLIVPWKPLSLGDFITYDESIKNRRIVDTVLEEEIFLKCVTDKELVRNINDLPAGVITTVAHNIMGQSGPAGIDHFNNLLDEKRHQASNPIHKLVPLIIRAFPSYKLEDVYNLSYDLFMFRLAQAEELLIKLGILKEPISLVEENKKPKKKFVLPELKTLWEKQQKKTESPIKEPPPSKLIPPENSPIFDKNKKVKTTRNLDQERTTIEQAVQTQEENVLRAKMIRDVQVTHKDIIGNMEFYKKKKAR